MLCPGVIAATPVHDRSDEYGPDDTTDELLNYISYNAVAGVVRQCDKPKGTELNDRHAFSHENAALQAYYASAQYANAKNKYPRRVYSKPEAR